MSVDPGRPLRVVRRAESAFCARLKARRSEDGLTQADLADVFEVRQGTIGAWERGTIRPQKRFWAPLADYLQLADANAVVELLDTLDTGGPSPAASPSQPVTSAADDRWDAAITDLMHAVSDRIRQGPLSRQETALFREMLEFARQRE